MMQSVTKIWLRRQEFSTSPYTPADNIILQALYHRILAMPSAKIPDLPSSNDYVYEACRLTSVLLIQSIEINQHWRNMAADSSFLQETREALLKTNLDGLWGKNIGLLYFVVLIFHTAAFGTPDYIFGHVLHGRISFELTYSYNDWHGALQPMAVLSDLIPKGKSLLTAGHGDLALVAGNRVTSADTQIPVDSTVLASSSDFVNPEGSRSSEILG
jgi:hypothetical protein